MRVLAVLTSTGTPETRSSAVGSPMGPGDTCSTRPSNRNPSSKNGSMTAQPARPPSAPAIISANQGR